MSRPRILIVDDDTSIVDVLKTFFDLSGIPYDAALNGKDALKAIERKKPDLILLDLRMPVMDGYTFLRILRGRPETKNLSVVVMTAYQDVGEIAASLPVQGWIQKPFDLDIISELAEKASAA